MVKNDDEEIIFVQLLDEGVIVFRPTIGKRLDNFVYTLLPTDNYDPSVETWEFVPGKKVHCKEKVLNGQISLVAFEEVLFP
jgi:hypothetical protein